MVYLNHQTLWYPIRCNDIPSWEECQTDIRMHYDLKAKTKSMGIEKIFDTSANAFASFAEEIKYISSMKQTSKIEIDENGCTAASYTELIGSSSGPRNGKAEIILNRPFIYVLYKEDIPFLIGVVRNPME